MPAAPGSAGRGAAPRVLSPPPSPRRCCARAEKKGAAGGGCCEPPLLMSNAYVTASVSSTVSLTGFIRTAAGGGGVQLSAPAAPSPVHVPTILIGTPGLQLDSDHWAAVLLAANASGPTSPPGAVAGRGPSGTSACRRPWRGRPVCAVMSKIRDGDRPRAAGRGPRAATRQARLKKNRHADARVAAPPPNGGRQRKKEDAAFRECSSLMPGKKKFRPGEKRGCRRRAGQEDGGGGGGGHATTVSGRGAFCACDRFRISTERGRRHVRLILLILGLPALRRPGGGRRRDRRRAVPVLQRPAFASTARGTPPERAAPSGTCAARALQVLGGDAVRPGQARPGDDHEKPGMRCRGTGTGASAATGRARRSAGERYPPRAAASLRAKRCLDVMRWASPNLRPTRRHMERRRDAFPAKKYALRVRVHGPRRAPAARRQGCRRREGGRHIAPLAREARESAGKMPRPRPGTAAPARARPSAPRCGGGRKRQKAGAL